MDEPGATTSTRPPEGPVRDAGQGAGRAPGLRAGAVGLPGVLFMALANAAPITAMTGNVPIAVGYGNGTGAPAGFVVATVVLTVFAVGFVAMTREVTVAGAFYGLVTRGLGPVAGTVCGALATMAYMVFEGALVGIFASFAKALLEQAGAPVVHWGVYGLGCVALVGVLGHVEIGVSGRVLGAFLVAEVLVLVAFVVAVAVHGGGPDGLMLDTLDPRAAFVDAPAVAGGAAGSAAVGVFFALWSWTGFETTAVYAEESRDPRRNVPRATLAAVVGLGVFYTAVSWAVVAANGRVQGPVTARADAFALFLGPVGDLLGDWCVPVYRVLTVAGSFACAVAFHNAAARYLHAMARDLPWAGPRRVLGATHPRHGSPSVASWVQTGVTAAVTVAFVALQRPTPEAPDVPYVFMYSLLSLLGTLAVLVVQVVTCVAVVRHFGRTRADAGGGAVTRVLVGLVAPVAGGLAMTGAVWLLLSNFGFAAGAGVSSPLFTALPWLVVATALVGLGLGWARRRAGRAG